jgi:hypothetical protein
MNQNYGGKIFMYKLFSNKSIFIILFFSFYICIKPSIVGSNNNYDELFKNSNFKKTEIQQIISLLENAEKEGINTELLKNRIREGIAKQVKFKKLYKVINEKINYIKSANELIDYYIKLGMKYNNRNYCIESLSILLEKNFSKTDFTAITNLVFLRRMKLEDALILCKLLESKKSNKETKDIILYGLLEELKIDEIKSRIENKK